MNTTPSPVVTDLAHNNPRSPHWETVKKAYLSKPENQYCIFCGPGSEKLYTIEVHHWFPFEICHHLGLPVYELDERNFVSVCETTHGKPAPNHHLVVAHLGSYFSFNRNVKDDVAKYKALPGEKIKLLENYKLEEKNRPKPFDQWTEEEKIAFRKDLSATLPLDQNLVKKYYPDGLPKSIYD